MSQNFDLQQQLRFGCGQNGCGNHGALSHTCGKSFTDSTEMKCPDGNPGCSDETPCELCQSIAQSIVETRRGAVGGSACEAPDVKLRQDFKPDSSGSKCEFCQNPEGSNPACDLCVVLKKTQEVPPPFTKGEVEKLHANLKSGFRPSPSGRIFELVVPLSSLTIGSINWTMHNCAFSAIVQMLASSNAGLNSINQQNFAGYILAVIINHIQETGKCDPIVLEVFRLELTTITGNPHWSKWTDLVEFQALYGVCVRHEIIIDRDVEFVPINDDGSYCIEQALGKCGSKLVEARNWTPHNNNISDGILSFPMFDSRYRITAVILYSRDHLSMVYITTDKEFWLVDGKGKSISDFNAESTIRKLTIEQFKELCAEQGLLYFFEEIPLLYDRLVLDGRQGLPPTKVFYSKGLYFLYNNGNMFCETTKKMVNLQRPVFVTDEYGRHFEVIPPLLSPPSPQTPCAQVGWVPPPSPPPQYASGSSGPPPAFPPPQPPCASVIHVPQKKWKLVWFRTEYYQYDNEMKVLRSCFTDAIMDEFKAGIYEVQDKNTRNRFTIELQEVSSNPPHPIQTDKVSIEDLTCNYVDEKWVVKRNGIIIHGNIKFSNCDANHIFLLNDVRYNLLNEIDQKEFFRIVNNMYLEQTSKLMKYRQ